MSTPSEFIKKVEKANFRQLEIVIWLILAMVVFIYPASHLLSKGLGFTISNLFLFHYAFVFLSAFLLIFPILFRLIFGFLPFEYIRVKQKIKRGVLLENKGETAVEVTYEEKEETPEDYRLAYIKESKTISEKIFARSGVYLLAGTLTAFAGIGIFYSPLFSKDVVVNSDISQRLLDYLPRFGALFFIEFIAIFFLRQFRVMHEEYRYYEAIKRKRQDNLIILSLIEKHHDKKEIMTVLTTMYSDGSISGKLNKDETTQVIETQKIMNQETDILGKLVELVKQVKVK